VAASAISLTLPFHSAINAVATAFPAIGAVVTSFPATIAPVVHPAAVSPIFQLLLLLFIQ
jgi:hypothetical protein